MKIEIYGEPGESEKKVRLILRYNGYGGVKLVAVDANGIREHCANLLVLSEEGLYLNESINRDIGLPLDSIGRLKQDRH